MEHHRKLSHWLLLVAASATILAITFGYGAIVLDAVSATGVATTDEIVWLVQQGKQS